MTNDKLKYESHNGLNTQVILLYIDAEWLNVTRKIYQSITFGKFGRCNAMLEDAPAGSLEKVESSLSYEQSLPKLDPDPR